MTERNGHDVSYKVLLLGEQAVGKTSLMRCLEGKQFNPSMLSTIAVGVVTKVLVVNGVHVQLEVWDTAGQEKFRAITKSLFRGAQSIVLVYDVTSRRSFQLLVYWLKTIDLEFGDSTEDIPVFIVANKSDLVENREVSSEEGKKKADASGASLFRETSVKTDPQGVCQLFKDVAYALTERYNPQVISSSVRDGQMNSGSFYSLKLDQPDDGDKKKTTCCLTG